MSESKTSDSKGQKPNRADGYELLIRSDAGQLDKVTELLDLGVDPNNAHPKGSRSGFNKRGTPLHYACRSGHLNVVKKLLEAGANVHAVDKEQWNALHYACFNGHADIAALLVSLGVATEDRTSFEQATPCDFANRRRFTDIVELLGSEDPEAPHTEKERNAVFEKITDKYKRHEHKPFLFRYEWPLDGTQQVEFLRFLDQTKSEVSLRFHDAILKVDVKMTMRSSFDEHRRTLEEMNSRSEAYIRASSVSAFQHFIVIRN